MVCFKSFHFSFFSQNQKIQTENEILEKMTLIKKYQEIIASQNQ